jgi:hypothetical protein
MLALREVVEALDRRLPQIERAGEIRIVRDAMLLRREATARIAELKRRVDEEYDDTAVAAVMTDDGAP